MAIRMYDLAGADPARRFSPYCWRTRMALAMKGLDVETIPWRFTQKDALAPHGGDKVPLLLDGDRAVSDSWAIAEYLEDTYPDRPSLFAPEPAGKEAGRALSRFVNGWADSVLLGGIARMVVADIHAVLDPADQDYFRTSREKRFGMTLEAAQADRDTRVEAFRRDLYPLRAALRATPFLGGSAPNYADAIVFGCFQWPRCVSPFRLLAADDLVEAWRQRMLDLHGGLARQVPSFD